jgi:hypothetical protein
LFLFPVQYAVPLYQRPYVWKEDDQWAPLWEDIRTVAEHLLDQGVSAQSPPTHFLGAIVIQPQQPDGPGSPQRFLVIDGQQRLTTLQLLLAAVSRTAGEMGHDDVLGALTANDPRLATGDQLFKVWPTNVNRDAFKSVMDPGHPPITQPVKEIQQAYAFFCQQIRLWIADQASGAAEAEQFKMLQVTLRDLLKVVSITLDDGDSPQVIFETLNGRGTPLISLDLLKNAVFQRAASQNADPDALYALHWRPELDRDYWRDDQRAGRLRTKNGDLFLQYWLVAELGEQVPATEFFLTFQARVLRAATCPPMTSLIPRLAHDAAVLRQFYQAETGNAEHRFSQLLALLDTTTLMPIVLLLQRSNDVTPQCRARAYAILESFLVRRMLCNLTTKAYNRLVPSLVKELKGDLARADTILQRRLSEESSPTNRWPGDDQLRAVLLGKDLYGQRRQDRLVMVLWKIEERLRAADKMTEQGLARPGKLTLEHIIPQSWGQHWPLDDGHEDPAGWRDGHLHRLGNLTLTTGQLNASLSNLPWHTSGAGKDKRRSLSDHSLLKLNAMLRDRYPERFDERSVDERGAQLAEIIIQLWPGPGQESATAAGPLGVAQAAALSDRQGDGGADSEDSQRGAEIPAATANLASGQAGVRQPTVVPSPEDALHRRARELLLQGKQVNEIGGGTNFPLWRAAFVEEAQLKGELIQGEPTAADAVRLKDDGRLRWEAVAARLFGDASPRRVKEAQALYEKARGPGSAKRSRGH